MNTTAFMQMSHANCAMKASDMAYEIETLRRQLAESKALSAYRGQQLAEKDAEIARLTTKNLEWLAAWNKDQETITHIEEQLAESHAEVITLRQQKDAMWFAAAESQAREVKLRGWVEKWCKFDSLNMDLQEWFRFSAEYRALPSDNTALREMIERAGEVMRKRCRDVAFDMAYADSLAVDVSQTIRALPGVTLENLK